ncbi:putative relative of glutathione S-transferase, MAPEG superfamily [Tritonibacter multivorans]|uniref:Putative relative of glutathione S-transferase, MAPEG superfamily n=1 Tax=Tritonibacter multivorans TaxID=928856 RepID=A0A0P1GGX2_9RHOB|nr:MAPEG family protein [Tritonibacter multivorans]MDA7420654.1 MAPEG family protein [Tritonibacter multivorans]CUH81191.1 putative relative of glutathione S-transferase, MAPEG superfamily [Tritonibacter multivorans]SFC30440.1 MAPEG family protein [Tritonibacter multivorans]
MTPELFYLTLTALLAGSLWIPFIVGVSSEPEDYTDFTRPPDQRRMRDWVQRAFRAHQNMLETLLPFAIVVLIAHLAGISTWVTSTAAAAFFWIRILHAAGMISGLATFPIRPILFTASYACTVAIALALLFAPAA